MATAGSRAARQVAEALRGDLLARLGEVCREAEVPDHTRAALVVVASSEERIGRILYALGNALLVEVAEASLGIRPGDPTRPV